MLITISVKIGDLTMTTTNILDFDDYAKPIDFKFSGNSYRIPALNKQQMESLMQLSRERAVAADAEDNITDNAKSIDDSIKYLDMQDQYIAIAVIKIDGENVTSALTMDEISTWPIKVKNKVMKTINDQMAFSVDDELEKK
jgi:hypothetical protein